MKKIVCFGDSNTYGFNPSKGSRYSSETRWSGILKTKLLDEYEIIEAGCNDRTCFSDNPNGDEYTGIKALGKYIDDNTYIIILAVGINDLQIQYNPTESEIENGINLMIQTIKDLNKKIKIILASPSIITDDILNGYFSMKFDKTSIKKSEELSKIYKNTAEEQNCFFIDLNKIAKLSRKDGLHYEPEEHAIIAEEMHKLIKAIKN